MIAVDGNYFRETLYDKLIVKGLVTIGMIMREMDSCGEDFASMYSLTEKEADEILKIVVYYLTA